MREMVNVTRQGPTIRLDGFNDYRAFLVKKFGQGWATCKQNDQLLAEAHGVPEQYPCWVYIRHSASTADEGIPFARNTVTFVYSQNVIEEKPHDH